MLAASSELGDIATAYRMTTMHTVGKGITILLPSIFVHQLQLRIVGKHQYEGPLELKNCGETRRSLRVRKWLPAYHYQ